MLEPLDYLRSLPCVPLSKAATARFESARKTGIYAICVSGTNTSDTKIYVGSAMQSFCKRMTLHRWGLRSGSHHVKGLQAVFNAYGIDCLYFRLVEHVDRIEGETKEAFRDRLISREQFWIDAVPTEIRLNGSPTAGSNAGIKMRPEVRERHGLRVRLALAKPETKAKHSESTKRMWLDPDYRSRLIAARVLMWQCPEYRAKFLESAKKSYANNPERIEALRIAGRKNWEDPELRARMTEINREICSRPEVKEFRSNFFKELWANPEWRKRQESIFSETFATDEYRQKLKDGQARFKETEGYQDHLKAIGERTKLQECSRSLPRIIISPSFDVYVTDSINQFVRDINPSLQPSGLIACAAGQRPTHKGWRSYTLDRWSDVPHFAIHHTHVDHEGLQKYIPFTQEEKQIFISKEKELRRVLKQDVYDQWLKNKLFDLGTKSDPCIFISPDGIQYVTDVPTQLAEMHGFKENYQKSEFTVLANGKRSSYSGWKGYKLKSWVDVPNDAIRALWGNHPELPEQTQKSSAIIPVQAPYHETRQKIRDHCLKKKFIDLGTKANPYILVSPDGIQYVTDVPTQFAEAKGYKESQQKRRFSLLAKGKCLSYLDWTGYQLNSWSDVPNDAIRVLWGDHPDLPPQTQYKQSIIPIQLSLNI